MHKSLFLFLWYFKFAVFILMVFNIVNLGLYLVVFLNYNYCHVLPSLNKVATYLLTYLPTYLSLYRLIKG